MKRILLVLAILAFPIQALCAPFLTSDCTPPADKVTGFQLQFGTATPIDVPAVECSPAVMDGKRIYYDLGTLPNGPFSVKALAKNLWGSSAWTVPLSDSKGEPTFPASLRIIP